jgi:D-alanyl-D-alanine carboxypeptidase
MISKSLKIWFATAAISSLALAGALSPALANPSIAVDVASGKVYSAQDPFQRWYPASLTKMMTAYVTFRAIEAGQLTLESPVRMTGQRLERATEQDGLSSRLGDDARYCAQDHAGEICQ